MKYSEFWPLYLDLHSKWWTKFLHTVGTIALTIQIVAGFILGKIVLGLLTGAITGYACAWLAHFWVEGNWPATFKNPVYSLISDFRMAYLFLTGKFNQGDTNEDQTSGSSSSN